VHTGGPSGAGSPLELELPPLELDDEPSPLLDPLDSPLELELSAALVCVLVVAATEVEPSPVSEPPPVVHATGAPQKTSQTIELRNVDTRGRSYAAPSPRTRGRAPQPPIIDGAHVPREENQRPGLRRLILSVRRTV